MSPARANPPVVTGFRSGRVNPSPASLVVPSPPAPQWPDATTTGYLNAPGYPGSLQDGSAVTFQSNTTYSFYRFTGGVLIGSNAAPLVNVTFHGCLFETNGGIPAMNVGIYGDNFTFSYCTLAPTGVAPYGPPGGVSMAQSYQYGITFSGAGPGTIGTFCEQLLVDHCDIWGFGNYAIGGGGGTQAKPHVFQHNFIHDLCQDMTYHSDGIGLPAGGASAYDVLYNNTINALANTQAIAYQNSPGPASWDHFTITDNLLGGFGLTVCVVNGTPSNTTGPTNTMFTDNTFTTEFLPIYGPLYDAGISSSALGNLWRRNKWLVPPGAQWGHAQYSGYFWMPVVNAHASPTQDELAVGLVSPTDFTG